METLSFIQIGSIQALGSVLAHPDLVCILDIRLPDHRWYAKNFPVESVSLQCQVPMWFFQITFIRKIPFKPLPGCSPVVH